MTRARAVAAPGARLQTQIRRRKTVTDTKYRTENGYKHNRAEGKRLQTKRPHVKAGGAAAVLTTRNIFTQIGMPRAKDERRENERCAGDARI